MPTRHRVFAALLFALTACTADGGPRGGGLVVLVASSGAEIDQDGYVVALDVADSTAVAAQDTLTYAGLAPGPHVVRLNGIAGNCTRLKADTARVAVDEVDTVSFAVSCFSTTATLKVTAVTQGMAPDPDGYAVTVDGGAPHLIGDNDTTGPFILAVGAHSVALSGVVMNCTPNTAGPYPLYLGPGATSNLVLTITCALPPVIAEWKGGATPGIVALNPDGSNPTLLLPDTGGMDYREPSWSRGTPGRLAFAFRRNGGPRGVGTRSFGFIDALEILREDTLDSHRPRWWFGGADDIAFLRPDSVTGKARVHLIDPYHSAIPWSPDSLLADGVDRGQGGRTVFTATGTDGASRLYLMTSDTTAPIRLTPDSITDAAFPRLAPYTEQVAFVHGQSLYVISTQGTGLIKVPTPGYTPLAPPAWSDDATRLMVGVLDQVTGGAKILTVTTAGVIQGTLTAPNGSYLDPDWH